MTQGDPSQTVINELIELDEEVNYRVLGGHKGETISSRCGRAIKRVANVSAGNWDFALLILAGVIQAMPWFGPNHCVRAIQAEFIKETE